MSNIIKFPTPKPIVRDGRKKARVEILESRISCPIFDEPDADTYFASATIEEIVDNLEDFLDDDKEPS